jgi:hypothetical protein
MVFAGLLVLALVAFPVQRANASGCPGCGSSYAPYYGYGPCFTPAYAAWGLPAPNDQGGYPGYPGSPYNYPGAAYGFPPPAPGFGYGYGVPSYWYGH